MAELSYMRSRVQFAQRLLFIRSAVALYRQLSLNICGEVLSYIGLDCILATIKNRELLVYNLTTATYKKTATNMSVSLSGRGVVMIGTQAMLIVGGSGSDKSAKSVAVWSGQVTVEQDMQTERGWPGMLLYEDRVWVFGGNSWPSLRSVERFHVRTKRWDSGPTMITPKACFSPVAHKSLVYLPETSPSRKLLEVLDPATDTYQLLTLSLRCDLYGSVAAIVNEELFVINYDRHVGKWPLNSNSTTLEDADVSYNDTEKCFSNGPPMRCRDRIYWLSCEFNLVEWDLQARTVQSAVFSQVLN